MRSRGIVFAVLLAVCVAGAAMAVVLGARDGDASAGGSPAALNTAAAAQRPTILFRDTGGHRGHVGLATPGTPVKDRTTLPLRCERVAYEVESGLCLARGGGFADGYQANVFGPDLKIRGAVDVQGIPSRARVSPDGRYGTVTLFVSGHSYAAAGSFSTQTTLIDLAEGRKVAELEQFVVTRNGRRVTAVDRNFWGVTFMPGDSDRFYATMATGGRTYLIEGSVSGRDAHTVHENVECPSISPDGTRIAYKKRTGSESTPWHLTVLDLKTMRETPLAEPRSVDDQAEWLDDDHVLYGIDGDTYAVPADGTGEPARYLAGADSPAVVGW
jgi:WD40-like Beta Propeller Repeat